MVGGLVAEKFTNVPAMSFYTAKMFKLFEHSLIELVPQNQLLLSIFQSMMNMPFDSFLLQCA